MTLSIDDLARENEFSLALTSLGTIRFRSLKVQDISKANKKLSYIDAQSLPFVRWLFSELAMNLVEVSTDSVNSIEDKSLFPEDLALVTDKELEDFAGKLLQKNRHLLKSEKATQIEMSVDESVFDFLVRAFRHYASEQRSRWGKITKPAFPDYPFNDMKNHVAGFSRIASQLQSVQDLMRAHLSPFNEEIHYFEEASLSFKLANALYQNESLLREATRAMNRTESTSAIFESELERQLLGARELLQNYESMFRLPSAGEVIHLFDSHEIGKVAEYARRHLTEMPNQLNYFDAIKTPWLSIAESARSVSAMLELQGIGKALRTIQGFDLELTEALRQDLGDWRDKITFPEIVFIDPVARIDFYAARGFNTTLTDFPEAAFHQSLQLAGLDGASLDLELYGHIVSPSADPNEESGLKRTNRCHDYLQRFERQLRQFINTVMTDHYGSDWPRKQLPPNLYESWESKQRRAESNGTPLNLIIEAADFTDYEVIICRKDHWREVFEVRFKKKESVRESLQRLQPIRVATMHARIVTREDELYLVAEILRLLSATK